MEKITSREILHQIREEAAKKISDSRCRILSVQEPGVWQADQVRYTGG